MRGFIGAIAFFSAARDRQPLVHKRKPSREWNVFTECDEVRLVVRANDLPIAIDEGRGIVGVITRFVGGGRRVGNKMDAVDANENGRSELFGELCQIIWTGGGNFVGRLFSAWRQVEVGIELT